MRRMRIRRNAELGWSSTRPVARWPTKPGWARRRPARLCGYWNKRFIRSAVDAGDLDSASNVTLGATPTTFTAPVSNADYLQSFPRSDTQWRHLIVLSNGLARFLVITAFSRDRLRCALGTERTRPPRHFCFDESVGELRKQDPLNHYRAQCGQTRNNRLRPVKVGNNTQDDCQLRRQSHQSTRNCKYNLSPHHAPFLAFDYVSSDIGAEHESPERDEHAEAVGHQRWIDIPKHHISPITFPHLHAFRRA